MLNDFRAKRKARRKQRLLKQITMLEAMDNRLWWQAWISFGTFFLLVFVGIGFAINDYSADSKIVFIFVIPLFLFFLEKYGSQKTTNRSYYTTVAISLVFTFIIDILISLAFNTRLHRFSPATDSLIYSLKNDKPTLKKHLMTRDELIAQALAKRRAIYEKL